MERGEEKAVKGNAIVVNKRDASFAIRWLIERDILDDGRKIRRYNDKVEIPVKKIPDINIDFEIVKQIPRYRNIFVPYEEIRKQLRGKISEEDYRLLPRKWEKIGDVLIIKMRGIKEKEKIARVYANVLNCKAVLEDFGIYGVERKPVMKFLYGNNAETIHIENRIKYKLNVEKIMFSSGNIDERIRMAGVAKKDEVVVDMFAGIGYFTLPIAVYSGAKVYACEINPLAYRYLKENIKLNGVEELVEARLGDCRKVAPAKVADRVVMGYLDSIHFIEYALKCLKNGGILHIHQNCKQEDFPHNLFKKIKSKIKGRRVKMIYWKKIKSYAPRIIHGVIDVSVE